MCRNPMPVTLHTLDVWSRCLGTVHGTNCADLCDCIVLEDMQCTEGDTKKEGH